MSIINKTLLQVINCLSKRGNSPLLFLPPREKTIHYLQCLKGFRGKGLHLYYPLLEKVDVWNRPIPLLAHPSLNLYFISHQGCLLTPGYFQLFDGNIKYGPSESPLFKIEKTHPVKDKKLPFFITPASLESRPCSLLLHLPL